MLKMIAIVLCVCFVTLSAQTYWNLTVTAGPHGTTIPSGTVLFKDAEQTRVHGDPDRVVTAIADSGYIFDHWEIVDGNVTIEQKATAFVDVNNGDVAVKAHFVERGEVHEITRYNKVYDLDTTTDTVRCKYFLRFTAPAPGSYSIIIDGVPDTAIVPRLYYYGTDPAYTNGGYTDFPYVRNAYVFTAQDTGEEHYFTASIESWSARRIYNDTFIVRYENTATLTIEKEGGYSGTMKTGPIADLPYNVPIGMKVGADAGSPYATVSPFSHWEVIRGNVSLSYPDSLLTYLIVNSDSAVVRAVFTKNKADTLIVQSNGHGNVDCYDTVFTAPGEESIPLRPIPDELYEFDSWSVIDGDVTLKLYDPEDIPLEFRYLYREDDYVAKVSGGKATIRANFRCTSEEVPPEVTITSVDISGHKKISVNVWVVDSIGRGVTGLDATNFALSEDGVSLPFSCTSIAQEGGMTVSLVFCTGESWHETVIDGSKAAAKEFIKTMRLDDRCSIVQYGPTASLLVGMTGDTNALNQAIDGLFKVYGVESPQAGLDLGVAQLIDEMEPRMLIMYTNDINFSHDSIIAGSGKIFPIDSAVNNNVTTYIIRNFYNITGDKIISMGDGFYMMTGTSPEHLAKLNKEMRVNFGSRYILTYETPDTVFNGDTHTVAVKVTRNSKVDVDTAYWNESNEPPKVELTSKTEGLLNKLHPEDTMFTITADVTDDGTIKNVVLYYRPAGSRDSYTDVTMKKISGSKYSAIIPAEDVHSPGVDFYIVAKDEFNLKGNSPKILYPRNDPWTIFAGGDELQPPIITLTSPTLNLIKYNQNEDSSLIVSAVVKDDGAVDKVKLFYRASGSDSEYSEVTMTIKSGNIYEGTIPANAVRSPGVEFYLMATDDIGLVTKSSNIPDEEPLVIPVEKNKLIETMVVKTAAAFADNGFGRVDRVEIYYYKSITEGNLPDSLRICWPDSNQFRIVTSNSMTIDSNDSTHLSVNLPEPFPEGFTRYNGWNGTIGTVYQKDNLGENVALPFAIEDSVGPLIARAQFIELTEETQNDTLVIRFTEFIDYETLKGQSLTLLKCNGQGAVTEIPLMVSAAFPSENSGSITVVIPFTDEASALQEGDSLRITADGPVVDEAGNRAHSLNRPVELTIKRDPPEIKNAVYEDRDADGMVDTVRIIFSRLAPLDGMEIKFEWNGTTGNATMANFKRAGSGSGGDTIDVNIAALFSKSAMKDRTSGNMLLTVRFTDYDEIEGVKNASVSDGAAPVLTAMRYHFGQYLDDNLSSADTLFAQFSEPLSQTPSAREPFLFCSGDGTNYHVYVRSTTTVSLDTAGNGNWEEYYRFLVTEATSGRQEPTSGNFGWINTAIANNIIDAGGTVQTNERNRKVPVYLKLPQLHLKLQAGPVPFNPIDGDRFTIRITGNDKVPGTTEYRVRAFIYDMMGSVVKRFPEDFRNSPELKEYCNSVNGRLVKDGANWYLVTTDASRIFWDGTNRQHRIVGKGTYMVVPQIYYTTSGNTTLEYPSERILVGVKR